jgi:uncharacterized protein (TIGR03086 family)
MTGDRRRSKMALVPDRTDVAALIRLGRDREAAALGSSITTKGESTDALAQLDQLAPVLGDVFGSITPADLGKQTPCKNFTVEGVLEHMVGGAGMFTQALGAQPAPRSAEGVLADIGPSLEALFGAINAPGALDRTVAAPFGEVSGDKVARYLVLDGLVHGWDISTATGRSYNPPAAVVSAAESLARELLDPLRDGDTFAEPTTPPADATPIQRLAAYTGRTVREA